MIFDLVIAGIILMLIFVFWPVFLAAGLAVVLFVGAVTGLFLLFSLMSIAPEEAIRLIGGAAAIGGSCVLVYAFWTSAKDGWRRWSREFLAAYHGDQHG